MDRDSKLHFRGGALILTADCSAGGAVVCLSSLRI